MRLDAQRHLRARERRRHLGQRHAVGEGNRGGGQRTRDDVPAGERGAHRRALVTPVEAEGDALQPSAGDLRRAHVGVGRGAVGEGPGPRSTGHRQHQRVVGVEHGEAVGRQTLQQLRLGRGDRLQAAQPLQVRRPHVRYHAHLRPRDLAERADLAGGAHRHLEHRPAMAMREAEQRQRQADLVVVVRLVLQQRIAAAEDGGDELFRRRLAHAARHADHLRPPPVAASGGQPLEGGQRVRHHEDGDGGRQRGRRLSHEHASRATLDGVRDEGVSVATLARQREEEIASAGLPRVDDRPAKARRAAAPPLQQQRAQTLDDLNGSDHGEPAPSGHPRLAPHRPAGRRDRSVSGVRAPRRWARRRCCPGESLGAHRSSPA